MAGLIGFFKGEPTEYVIRYQDGRAVQEGQGLAFFYTPFQTSIVAVPTSSVDVSFVFQEATGNFQSVTIQGQFTYRIVEPRRATQLLNFTIEPHRRKFLTSDPEKLNQRITNVIQIETRREVLVRSLEQTLGDSEAIASVVLGRVRNLAMLEAMGVELISVYFLSAKPTPEVAKALEASYREQLLRTADEAIYARRAAAVAEERKIRENELQNQIALEQQRRSLLELEGANAEQEANFRGRALEIESSYRARSLKEELESYQVMEPRALLALGLREIGQNAAKIGNLTITTEMLAALLGTGQKDS